MGSYKLVSLFNFLFYSRQNAILSLHGFILNTNHLSATPALFLSAVILAILSLYWGALFHVEKNLSSLVIWVVDFDAQVAPYNETGIEPVVGPMVVRAVEEMIGGKGSLGWGSLPASRFGGDPMEVRREIYEFKAWAVSWLFVSFDGFS